MNRTCRGLPLPYSRRLAQVKWLDQTYRAYIALDVRNKGAYWWGHPTHTIRMGSMGSPLPCSLLVRVRELCCVARWPYELNLKLCWASHARRPWFERSQATLGRMPAPLQPGTKVRLSGLSTKELNGAVGNIAGGCMHSAEH